MAIDMSQHIGWGRLLKYVLPSIAMMIFASLYGIVDGFFVSNFAGKTALAAVNFIMPVSLPAGSLSCSDYSPYLIPFPVLRPVGLFASKQKRAQEQLQAVSL